MSTDSRNVRLTATIQGYPYSNPAKKVSGTNENFAISIDISSITNTSGLPKWTRAYIYSFKVELGDETVLEYTAPNNGDLAHVYRRVHWDTTHFGHGSVKMIKITAKMKMERGLYYTAPVPGDPYIYALLWEAAGTDPMTVDAPVDIYNYAHLGQIYEFEGYYSPLQSVEQVFDNSTIGWYENDPANLERSLNGIRQSTIYYLYCHGNDGSYSGNPSFGAGEYEMLPEWFIYCYYNPSQPNSIDRNVLDQRVQAYAQHLPPMNFAFIDCCLIAVDNSAAESFLWPFGETLTNIIDRAFLAYKVTMWTSWSVHFDPVLWESLLEGNTVLNAVTDAYDCLADWANNEPVSEDTSWLKTYGNNWIYALTIFGDSKTRMHTLYDASYSGPVSYWYEVLYE